MALNDSGLVAFGANLEAGGSGVFTGNGGAATPILLSSNVNELANGVSAINAAGTVVFVHSRVGGPSGLFVGNASGTNLVHSGSIGSASINNAGQVAFLANPTVTDEAIFVGTPAGTQSVLRRGDPLFGSTVTQLRLGTTALNDAGQVAFAYTLADGRNGIAVPRPPLIRITSIARWPGGTIHLEVSGAPNAAHLVQATTNLSQPFASISTNVAAADGTFPFDDTNAPAFLQRFYRAALP